MQKRGVSDVVTGVLLVLVAIVAVALIAVVILNLVGNTEENSGLSRFISKTGFVIETPSQQDILNDRFRVENTGQTTLRSYEVSINGIPQNLTGQKKIEPKEKEYLYLGSGSYFPTGDITLKVKSNDYVQEIIFNAGTVSEYKLILDNSSLE